MICTEIALPSFLFLAHHFPPYSIYWRLHVCRALDFNRHECIESACVYMVPESSWCGSELKDVEY